MADSYWNYCSRGVEMNERRLEYAESNMACEIS